MLQPFTSLYGLLTLPTYPLRVGIGMLLAIAVVGWISRHHGSFAAVLDQCLGGLAGGLLLARAGHLLLHLDYFAAHPADILNWQAGGLDWHGAVIGALAGIWLTGRLRPRTTPLSWTALAFALPLIAVGGWWGCEAVACAYGAEITRVADYPAWLVWEAPDLYGLVVPRYHTQQVGMLLALLLLAVATIAVIRGWRWHFGFTLVLFSGGMFAIGFLRGDRIPVWQGIRLDQWADLAIGLLGLVLIRFLREIHPAHSKSGDDPGYDREA